MIKKLGSQISICHGLLLIVIFFFFQGCIGTIEEKIINEIKKEPFPKKSLLFKLNNNKINSTNSVKKINKILVSILYNK